MIATSLGSQGQEHHLRKVNGNEEIVKGSLQQHSSSTVLPHVEGNGDENESNGKTSSGAFTGYKKEPSSAPLANTTFSHVFLPTYKVLIAGDPGVGKSNLLSRFTRDQFDINTPSTIGVEFTSRELEVPSAQVGQTERVIVQLWDTAGQERCGVISTAFFRNAVGVIFVYDVTRLNTLIRIPMWVEYVRKHTCEDSVCIIIGNKTDLSHLCTVSEEDAEDLAHRLGMRHFLASALNGDGVSHALTQLVLALSTVQNAKRSAAAAAAAISCTTNTANTGGGGSQRVQLGSSSTPRSFVANGTVWSIPLSSHTVTAATSSVSTVTSFPSFSRSLLSQRPANGRQMDLRGFGCSDTPYNRGSKPTSDCCS